MLKILLLSLTVINIQAQQFTPQKFFQYIDSTCKFPEIVKAQAILETAYFNSRLCRQDHNYFGMTDFYSKDYAKYKHWTESVQEYSNWQKRRLKETKVKSYRQYLALLDKKYCWEVNYSERLISVLKSKRFKTLTKK